MGINKKPKCQPQNYQCGRICIKGVYVCHVDGLTGQSVSIADKLEELVKTSKTGIDLTRPKGYKLNNKTSKQVNDFKSLIDLTRPEGYKKDNKTPKKVDDVNKNKTFEQKAQQALDSIKEKPLGESFIGKPVAGGKSKPTSEEFQSAQINLFNGIEKDKKIDVNSLDLSDLETYYEGSLRIGQQAAEELIEDYDKSLKLDESDILLFRQFALNREFLDLGNLLKKEGKTNNHQKLGDRLIKEMEEKRLNLYKRKYERDSIPKEVKTKRLGALTTADPDLQDLENEKGHFREDGYFSAKNLDKPNLGYPDDIALNDFDNWVERNS